MKKNKKISKWMNVFERVCVYIHTDWCIYASERKHPNNSPSMRLAGIQVFSSVFIVYSFSLYIHPRAALTTHKFEWLEPWGKLAELELKCSNRELVYVGNTNVTLST